MAGLAMANATGTEGTYAVMCVSMCALALVLLLGTGAVAMFGAGGGRRKQRFASQYWGDAGRTRSHASGPAASGVGT